MTFVRGKEAQRRAAAKRARPAPLVPKRLGESAVDKGPLVDRSHRARVAEAPCMVCGLRGLTQAHHIRECFPRTMGVRIGDEWCVPLCVTHHAELHAINNETFWKHYHLDPKGWARRFYKETAS